MSPTTYGPVSTKSTPQSCTTTTYPTKQRNLRVSTQLSGTSILYLYYTTQFIYYNLIIFQSLVTLYIISGRYPQSTRVLIPKPNNSGFINSSSSGKTFTLNLIIQ